MRVRIAYSVDVSDEIRRAMSAHYGGDGLASRQDIKQWYEAFGESMNADLSMWADDQAEADEEAETQGLPTK